MGARDAADRREACLPADGHVRGLAGARRKAAGKWHHVGRDDLPFKSVDQRPDAKAQAKAAVSAGDQESFAHERMHQVIRGRARQPDDFRDLRRGEAIVARRDGREDGQCARRGLHPGLSGAGGCHRRGGVPELPLPASRWRVLMTGTL